MHSTWAEHSSALIRAIREDDEQTVEDAVRTLSQSRRIFAPLAFVVGAFVMLFDGVKLLFSNWRLALMVLLPAIWIWIAVFDLKAHTLRGDSFRELSGQMLIAIIVAIVAITAATFFLNAVFAFAIAAPPPPKIRPAFTQARSHLVVVLGSGAAVGVLLRRRGSMGQPLVRDLHEHHDRNHDLLLCRRAITPDRRDKDRVRA